VGGREGIAEETQDGDVKHIGYYIPLGGGRVFILNAVPADSELIPAFEPVLSSIAFTQ
jgi:hypothetical protein